MSFSSFPPEARFKYPWRAYQQRVLSELTSHLTDGHLHVVAPPGSGKTVLGLEVMRQLNRPTLILAPTLAIRNQWTQRFCELFLQTNECPDWISHDIHRPAWLTVSTYQSLHAACTSTKAAVVPARHDDAADVLGETAMRAAAPDKARVAALLAGFQAVGLGTLVLDEAHHLQNAWWKSLMQLHSALGPTVVSLTATPPYDISPVEWERYCAISGPVDAEISVPELLLAGDLCPHQDYVCFSEPTRTEGQQLVDFHTLLQAEYAALSRDATLVAALEQHPILLNPHGELDWIYANLPCYAASLIFLHANGRPLSPAQLAVLGEPRNGEPTVPALTPAWLETLLTFYLAESVPFAPYAEHRRTLEKHLRRQGLMAGGRVLLRHHPKLGECLSTSLSKLHSIRRIVAFEHDALGQRLRLVVLTDYIRKEFLTSGTHNDLALNKIGVVPIFEVLRRENPRAMRLGMLTGSLVVVPTAALPALQAAAHPLPVATELLPYDPAYSIVQPSAAVQAQVVRLVTHLFEQGHIEVLVGTKSLLGEGWDAPCLNALVLASFVGSFVLSNQMRGRAIRTQAGHATKTGNIWHLACLYPRDPTGGPDVALLRRRFRTFVGVSLPPRELGIKNGLARLALPDHMPPHDAAETLNAGMFAQAADRTALAARWQQALAGGRTLVEEIQIPSALTDSLPRLQKLYFNRTLAYLAAELVTALTWFGVEVAEFSLKQLSRGRSMSDVLLMLKWALAAALVLFGRKIWRTLRLYVAHRDIALDVQHIGEALLAALVEAGAVQPGPDLHVVAIAADDGSLTCHLAGGSTFEHSAFVRAMQELLRPLDNPRYVVVRQSRLFRLINQQDYHAVPEVLSRTKQLAAFFANQWQHRVGSCELIHSRTLDGRERLLHARARSLSAALNPSAEPASRWQ